MTPPATVFLTGGRGFIGRSLTEYLGGRYRLLTPTHKELDLTSFQQVEKFLKDHSPDYIIHCANIGGTRKTADTLDAVELNLRMFLNLLHGSTPPKHFISLGSGAEYDKSQCPPMVQESFFGRFIPPDIYGFSKFNISLLAAPHPRVTVLRVFGVFGAYEDYELRFISNAIIKNLLGLPITIHQNVRFDYLYVDDLCRLIGELLPAPPPVRAFNVSSGAPTDLLTIAGLINEVSGRPTPVRVVHQGLQREYSGDNGLLRSLVPSFHVTPMKTAIEDLFRYFQSHLKEINSDRIKEDPYHLASAPSTSAAYPQRRL